MPDADLVGKVAVVTGGSRGIGEAIARRFADAGAAVALCARGAVEIERVAAKIRDKGGRVLATQVDITVEPEVERFAEAVVAEFGSVDVLVNNAGGNVRHSRSPLVETALADWRHVMDLNFFGTYLVTRAFLPHLNRGGKIINFGSGAGHVAAANEIGYRAAKAAVSMFTRCLALEVWQDGIDVNELVPGAVATTGLNLGDDRSSDATVQRELLGKSIGDGPEIVRHPDDPAGLALWLATLPEGGPTGQVFSLQRQPFH